VATQDVRMQHRVQQNQSRFQVEVVAVGLIEAGVAFSSFRVYAAGVVIKSHACLHQLFHPQVDNA